MTACLLFIFVLEKKEKDIVIERRYTIENVIGNGGFGTVYAGKRKKDGLLASISVCCRDVNCRQISLTPGSRRAIFVHISISALACVGDATEPINYM